jgi:hypothetical protein
MGTSAVYPTLISTLRAVNAIRYDKPNLVQEHVIKSLHLTLDGYIMAV